MRCHALSGVYVNRGFGHDSRGGAGDRSDEFQRGLLYLPVIVFRRASTCWWCAMNRS
jgi:hypothetical protein